jgi:hypothetical protein
MFKKVALRTSLIITVSFLVFTFGQKALAETAAPIILNTSLIEVDNGWQISVNGLTNPGNSVLIYVNGSYDRIANISKNDVKFYNFSYLSSLIKTISPFNVFAINKNISSSELSPAAESPVNTIVKKMSPFQPQLKKEEVKKSAPVIKTLEKTSPPVLISPAGQTTDQTPLISGFSQNNATIQIFINKILAVEVSVKNNDSGTATFEYYPTATLATGTNTVYAVAKKNGMKESEPSNILSFSIQEKEISAKKEVMGVKETNIQANSTSSVSQQAKIEQEAEKNSPKNDKGSIFNIVLFSIFIISIIIWIITINRELKKEAKEKQQK